MLRVACVIPAHRRSERLPEKLLLKETGIPLLGHAVRNALACPDFEKVYVATDDLELAAIGREFGATAFPTGQHACGTDRVAELARGKPELSHFVNLQGDEPEVAPGALSALVDALREGAEYATLADERVPEPEELLRPDRVFAFHFEGPNRERVWHFDRGGKHRDGGVFSLPHVGVYGYSRRFLLRFAGSRPSTLERATRLEQNRGVEPDRLDWPRIAVVPVEHEYAGIDTAADYRAFVEREAGRARRRAQVTKEVTR